MDDSTNKASAPIALPIAEATVASPQAIIDYAGPRRRQATRLPARSVLHVESAYGRVRVVETLSGTPAAIGAMVFALFTMAMMIWIPCGDIREQVYPRSLIERVLFMSLFPGSFIAAELLLIVLVIDSTWRRTILTVGKSDVVVGMFSPLRKRIYEWAGSELQSVCVLQMGTTAGGVILGEVEMRMDGREVRLFTDHEYETLFGIVSDIDRMYGLPAPSAPEGITAPARPGNR